MSKNPKGNHLTLSDRIFIEKSLNEHKRFNEIAHSLCKDPSTISKEIIRFMDEKPIIHYKGNDCKYFTSCTKSRLCSSCCPEFCRYCNSHDCRWLCADYEPNRCPGINTPPYVCNGCINSSDCSYPKQFYHAEQAHAQYIERLHSSRQGISLSPEQLQKLNDLVSPLIRQGQPLSHIYSTHSSDIQVSRRTLYNYLDQGLFDVRNLDLLRRVRYKLRKNQRQANPIQYDYRNRRTYRDFEKFCDAFPDYEVVEMDTVKGTQEAGKCLLTLLFRKSSFMLIFLLDSCTQSEVTYVFDTLYSALGRRLFVNTFRIILTDNGPEFKNPWRIEKDSEGRLRTKVFYCDPYASSQKGRLEKTPEFIRYVIL